MHFVSAIFVATLVALAAGHSMLTMPQSTSPRTCRTNGNPMPGVERCPGPCDLGAMGKGFEIHDSPSNPAAVYRRGQKFTIKYTRNNHPPGGFYRLTLVKPEKMMDKREHNKNAFYYSCWGGYSVIAAPNELETQRYGYSMVGSDGKQHDIQKGYYAAAVTMPRVVPDGDYVLGWVWYGGGAGGTNENNGRATKEPSAHGFFSDYWSCSFVRVEGGAPLVAAHDPIFNNDMQQFSSEGCMSANDSPGVCNYEPCKVDGKYQKPYEFKDGRSPRALTPADFGGSRTTTTSRSGPATRSAPAPVDASTTTEATTPEPAVMELAMTELASPEPAMTELASPEPDMTELASPEPTMPTTIEPSTTTAYTRIILSEEQKRSRRCCRCLENSSTCWPKLAERTMDYCTAFTSAEEQPAICRKSCCDFCKSRPRAKICATESVKKVCM